MTADFARNPVIVPLLLVRAIPALLAGVTPPGGVDGWPRLRLDDVARYGFAPLDHDPPHTIVLGLQGRFWRPDGELVAFGADQAAEPVPSGMVRALWSFTCSDDGKGGCLLATETRVICADAAARRSFLRYWRLVEPGSALIRRAMLSQVAVAVRHRPRPVTHA